jgi:hypothetical protein
MQLSVKEKGQKLIKRPLTVLKIPIIYFPLKASQETTRHHLPHDKTLNATTSPLASKQINYTAGQNPLQPTRATSQWRRKLFTDPSFFLHIQHQSTTMRCYFLFFSFFIGTLRSYFLRLYMVKIFPKAVSQSKSTS